MISIWTPRAGFDNSTPNLERCRASVWDRPVWSRDYQCQRKAVCEAVIDGKTYGFCKQHDPVAVQKRRDEGHKRWEQEWSAEQEKMRIRKLLPECKTALEQIAAGHNDPRALAIEVLAKFKPGGDE